MKSKCQRCPLLAGADRGRGSVAAACGAAEEGLGEDDRGNSETIVPTPRVKAKPLTPAVASTKRMNAVSR